MSDVEYVMLPEELDELLAASKPVPYLVVGGLEPESPRDRAMRVWAKLAAKYGFEIMSVRPRPGKDQRYFYATPRATP